MILFVHRGVQIELEESYGYSQISDGEEIYRVTGNGRGPVYRAKTTYGKVFALTPTLALETICKVIDEALAKAVPAEADQIEYAEFEPGGCWTNVAPTGNPLLPEKK
jgi:hypothetical protein